MDERNPAQRPELLLCQRGDERAAPAQRKEGSGLWLDGEPTWHRADSQLPRQAQRSEDGHGQLASKAAQREFIDAYMLYMLSAKKMYKLKHATIVDEKTGKTINGEDWVQGLCQPEILASFNAILSANPMMLENWQAVALADILGRELVVNGTYVAIEAEALRQCLIGE